MHKNVSLFSTGGPQAQPTEDWRYQYPSLADNFSFDYSKLMNASYDPANPQPLGTQTSGAGKSVAVIGAGISGTEVARELTRAGYKVDLFEASGRVGGRTYSVRAPKGDGTAQLTCYEQGAMRIPFFNTENPKIQGDGPYVGGPFNAEKTTANANSMAQFWANNYNISTAAFPDPGKAPGTMAGDDKTQSYSGVATGVFVNSGNDVDLVSLYPDPSDETKSVFPYPSRTFYYDWPAGKINETTKFPATKEEQDNVKYYNRGSLMKVTPPLFELGHAIPSDLDPENPISPPSTFGTPETNPNYKDDVNGWRAGIMALRTVAYKWSLFSGGFLCGIAGVPFTVNGKPVKCEGADWDKIRYNSPNWETFWQTKVMPRYQNVNFFEVAMAGPILPDPNTGAPPAEWLEGNFGGLGMSGAEAQLFYTVGAGDGSWGAFFPNSALWALRALLFGYANQHQLVLGCLNEAQDGIDTTLNPPPDQAPEGATKSYLQDSNKSNFWAPQYAGVNSFSQCHFFKPYDSEGNSFWSKVNDSTSGCHFYGSARVVKIKKNGEEDISITAEFNALQPFDQREQRTFNYNYVVCSVPIWNTQTDMLIEGFSLPSMPITTSSALDMSHWIRSCKVFVALKNPYWKQPNDDRTGVQFLPQVIASNTELQDMYGLAAPTPANPYPTEGGIALISYTWEDDAQKFLPYQEKELVMMLLDRLEVTLERMGLPSIKPFMQDPECNAPGSFTVWRWSLERDYHGCAKAYQTGIENFNSELLTYNDRLSKSSQLYLCGDAYSLESGWLEPALRMGLDVCLNLINNDPNATVTTAGGFNMANDYKTSKPIFAEQAQETQLLGPNPLSAADLKASGGGCCTTM